MFSNLFDALRNRRNGDKPQQNDTSGAIVVEINVTLPSAAPRDLGPALQKAISEAVMATVTSAMSNSRSPFNSSPFGGDDSDGFDIAGMIASALAARRRDENGENAPYGMPDLAEALRSMRERMGMPNDGTDQQTNTPLQILVQQILDDYFDEDYESILGRTAFAALALVRGENEPLAAPEISAENVEKAQALIERFAEGERHCCGLFFCEDEIVLQVLALHEELSITPEEVIDAYKAGDLSNKNAMLAIASLAAWDENFEMLYAGSIDYKARTAARQLVQRYRDENERFCTNCGGDFGCPVQLAYDVLSAYELHQQEEAAWAMHDQTEPAMAGADEGKNEAEEPVAATSGEPEFPHGTQQW